MAGYYIFAKTYAPAVFATLAGAMLGLGSLGNLASAEPMARAVVAFGWRETMQGLAMLSALIAMLLWVFLKNPPGDADYGLCDDRCELCLWPA